MESIDPVSSSDSPQIIDTFSELCRKATSASLNLLRIQFLLYRFVFPTASTNRHPSQVMHTRLPGDHEGS